MQTCHILQLKNRSQSFSAHFRNTKARAFEGNWGLCFLNLVNMPSRRCTLAEWGTQRRAGVASRRRAVGIPAHHGTQRPDPHPSNPPMWPLPMS
jgi:hypothetical protein